MSKTFDDIKVLIDKFEQAVASSSRGANPVPIRVELFDELREIVEENSKLHKILDYMREELKWNTYSSMAASVEEIIENTDELTKKLFTRQVRFLPEHVDAECKKDEDLFSLSKYNRLKIPSSCNGQGTCGLCRVVIREGEEHLNKQTEVEIRHLGNVYHITKERLACQCKFVSCGEVEVEIKNDDL